ncbi:hypothetical protein CH330_01520 [candidate division WOR-3 bacterium JGI_Cruoil_03_51_56]|uniref:Uncharacterized protein n=1 Tax=candidate division WOR-3 bacterium JGI_Cruoil_03_51_56 TaxID=1973747 RepID=A0A235BXP5_UNCW3|nr:MAG: hypothetical protein CH330_01520 [candidate division WOR-3 bacterium JGI_Cruoil_03_51_56]
MNWILGSLAGGLLGYNTGQNQYFMTIISVIRESLLQMLADSKIAPFFPEGTTTEFIQTASPDDLLRLFITTLRSIVTIAIVPDTPLEIALYIFYTKLVTMLGQVP